MKPTLVFLFLLLNVALIGQDKVSMPTDKEGRPVLYIYDGLSIRSPEYAKTLDSTNFEKVEVITSNVDLYHNLPDNVVLVIITTKEKVNKKLKAFTGTVSQITKDYPNLEYCVDGKILESDSLRLATFSRMKPHSYKISFYPPFRAVKKFGDSGKNAVIEVVPK